MVARGADYRVRWSEQQLLRPSRSLADLEESALSGDEGSYDSLIDAQRGHSQGVDNSSEGDRSSEAAEQNAVAGAGGKARRPRVHARSTPALEELLSAKRGGRRVHSLTDLELIAGRSSRQSVSSAVGQTSDAASTTFDLTHAVLRHRRWHSRQHSAHSWQIRDPLQHYSPAQLHFRKKSSSAAATRFEAFVASRHSTQNEGCTSPPFVIPDDTLSLLRAIEERDRQIASACHEKTRLVEKYLKLQQRPHSQTSERTRDSLFSQSIASGEQSASAKPLSPDIASSVSQSQAATELQVSLIKELIANVTSLKARPEAAAADGTEKLSETQVLNIILALNAQLSKLLV